MREASSHIQLGCRMPGSYLTLVVRGDFLGSALCLQLPANEKERGLIGDGVYAVFVDRALQSMVSEEGLCPTATTT